MYIPCDTKNHQRSRTIDEVAKDIRPDAARFVAVSQKVDVDTRTPKARASKQRTEKIRFDDEPTASKRSATIQYTS